MPEIKWRIARRAFRRARHDLRRRPSTCRQAPRGHHRQQVPDPGLRRPARSCPGLQVAGRRAELDRRVRPHRVLLLRGQGSDLRLRHGGSLRPQHPPAHGVDVFRRRARADQRVLQRLQDRSSASPASNTNAQMGGWWRKEIKTRRGHEGPEVPHRRLRRPGADQARRRTAADRRRRHLSRRSRRARSTRPSGSDPTTTRSSASTRSRRTTTIPAGGKAARPCRSTAVRRRTKPCRRCTRKRSLRLQATR
jgi:hypothetical protein